MHLAIHVVAVALGGLASSVAYACPDCNIGRLARNQFWNDNFASNLAIALAPFLFIVMVALWAERIGRPKSQATITDREAPHG